MSDRRERAGMAEEELDYEVAWERLVHRFAESVFDASDEEIEEEMRAAGEDPEEAADRLRARLREVARRCREEKEG